VFHFTFGHADDGLEGMPTVIIIGASPKPERISHQAVERYRAAQWTVQPVNPAGEAVAGISAWKKLEDVPGTPDIICLYVNPQIGVTLADAIAAKKPTLVWLNPGADGEPVASALRAKHLKVVEACTLVVLRQGDPLALGLAAAR
jgi:predicted CoA-binding protein